jgi:hypothetical protein
MNSERKEQEVIECVVPARTLRGTRADVLEQIDELIRGLVCVRQLVRQPDREAPVAAPGRHLRLVSSALASLLVLGALGWARPATAQTLEALAARQPSAGSAAAQEPGDPNPGRLTLTGSLDAVSTYMFRGIRQHSTGMALWPVADLGLALYSGDGGVKSVGLNVGAWNSLHTGDTGVDGPTGKLWYESDFYATLGVGLGGGTSLGTTYTAYTSPNNAFTTVKELAFRLGIDDTAYLGRAALKPYGLVAFEFDTSPGVGQADGGSQAGRYLELGVAPGYAGARASLSVPVKLGISLADYYELNTGTPAAPVFVDNRFGYVGAAALVTIPFGGTTDFGRRVPGDRVGWDWIRLLTEGLTMLLFGMIALGLVTFAAMAGFFTLCDRV